MSPEEVINNFFKEFEGQLEILSEKDKAKFLFRIV
jgi:hypothetical protein